MRCEQVQPWLGAWQDGEASRWQRWHIARHVAQCPECRAEAVALTQLTVRLKSADPVAECSVKPIHVPQIYRFGTLRCGMVAATVFLLALAGGYTHRWQAGNVTKTADTTTAVRQQGSPNIAPAATGNKPVVRVAQTPVFKAQGSPRSGKKKTATVHRRHRPLYPLEQPRQSPSLVSNLPPRKSRSAVRVVAVAPPVKPREVIEISVKITDPQQVVREYREEIAEAERIAARQQEYIYVVATPEVPDAAGKTVPVPDFGPASAEKIEELP